jgi:hypothetical protein
VGCVPSGEGGAATMKRLIPIPLAVVLLALMGGVVGADNTSNDRVLRGDKGEYIEYFKKDSANGDKNYLYTETEFKDKWGRQCTVVTGDSEQTIALDCEAPRG